MITIVIVIPLPPSNVNNKTTVSFQIRDLKTLNKIPIILGGSNSKKWFLPWHIIFLHQRQEGAYFLVPPEHCSKLGCCGPITIVGQVPKRTAIPKWPKLLKWVLNYKMVSIGFGTFLEEHTVSQYFPSSHHTSFTNKRRRLEILPWKSTVQV